jgi:NAD(P)-dependent dehydrogenase (short-subunit alcohol dehydrogenase family)
MSTQSPFSLAGKTALIAGASRGIGLATAQSIARAGARTILASRSLQTLAEAARNLRGEGFQAEAMELDIASRDSREKLVEALPPVDILINVAGINQRKRFEEYAPAEYQRILETNLTGVFELTQSVGRGMVDRGQGGKIVHIGSLMSVAGLPYVTVYAVTKSGLAGLTRSLAAEWGRHDIQVNCIAPGFIITDLNREMWQPPEMMQWLKGIQAMPRTGTPEEIAHVAVFLSSPASNYVTGQVISVDGGCSTTQVWPFEPAP